MRKKSNQKLKKKQKKQQKCLVENLALTQLFEK